MTAADYFYNEIGYGVSKNDRVGSISMMKKSEDLSALRPRQSHFAATERAGNLCEIIY